MDVNGTRTRLLLGYHDWAACTDETGQTLASAWAAASGMVTSSTLAWDATRNELTLAPEPLEFALSAVDTPVALAARRGAGADVFGNWYWVSSDFSAIEAYSVGDGSTSRFWPAADKAPSAAGRTGRFGQLGTAPPATAVSLAGAAVTEDHYLVVGSAAPPGLLVFDLETGGPPMRLDWPAGVDFKPSDIAARPGGGVFVLDAENHLAWELDRHLQVVPAGAVAHAAPAPVFEPVSPAAPAAAQPPASGSPGTDVPGNPIAIEAAPGGGFFVLDRDPETGNSEVEFFLAGVQVGGAVSLASPALARQIIAHDMAVVDRMLFVADAGGQQSFAYEVTISEAGLELSLTPSVYPMRLFGGKGIVAAGRQVYYDFARSWIALVEQPVARYPQSGTVTTTVLDSGIPGCQWHRLLVDACLPPGTGLFVWSVAQDDLDALALSEWRPEPDPLPRRSGPEVPFVDLGPYTPQEVLLQDARGRYLRLKLELFGTGRATPRVRAARVWFPRFSYLERYLPGVYREDASSASFLERFLANIEGLLTAVEDRIAAAQVLFDPASVPAEDLTWLAGWLALALDPLWDERRRRAFLANTMRFYQSRGTIRAVQIALRFVLDPCVPDTVFDDVDPAGPQGTRIIESFRTRNTAGVVFGDPTITTLQRTGPTGGRWTPDHGRDALNLGYATFLAERALPPVDYPLFDPGDETSAAWRAFSASALGFLPIAPEPVRWQRFLGARYANPHVLGAAYGLAHHPTGFEAVLPPELLPGDGAALWDWFQYQAIVEQMWATAHRFTVMLPWPLQVPDSSGDPGSMLTQSQLRDVTARVVELQKPAHTVFDIKFFWAAFRVGEVRLGLDTLLGTSSRAPELIVPALIGRDYLGASYLAGDPASDTIARRAPVPTTTTTTEEA